MTAKIRHSEIYAGVRFDTATDKDCLALTRPDADGDFLAVDLEGRESAFPIGAVISATAPADEYAGVDDLSDVTEMPYEGPVNMDEVRAACQELRDLQAAGPSTEVTPEQFIGRVRTQGETQAWIADQAQRGQANPGARAEVAEHIASRIDLHSGWLTVEGEVNNRGGGATFTVTDATGARFQVKVTQL
jgi:hypothetical protein